MTKLNKYQKIILVLYGICFVYFSVIHVPFKVYDSDEVVYDTLFSERANLVTSRLILILIVTSVAFAIILFLTNSIRLNLKVQLTRKQRLKPTLYILAVVTIIAAAAFILTENKSLFTKPQKVLSDAIVINAIEDTTSRVIKKEKPKPIYYEIKNVKSYSNEKFQEFVSFTFYNTSDETISNIMFKGTFPPARHKKDDFTNKSTTLRPNDSTKFIFNKDHDELFVYKIRFSSGETINLEHGFNSLYDNKVYSKLDNWWE